MFLIWFEKFMPSPFSRILELVGWSVVVITVLLLLAANHIDRYQPPQTDIAVQHK
ncbi:division septum protein Blr [Klebsiella sp. RIT-PI-d]|uniref:division septum protein Blr n=1 Tax=Klebsiella sp. RIT-PI-d TaxID=1681196 RepID=UPI000AC241B7